MRVRIRLFGALRERAGAGHLELDELPEAVDVAGAKLELARRRPELGNLEHVRGVLDNTYVPDAQILTDGIELSLLPPVSGGRGDGEAEDEALERGLFELCSEPLEPESCARRVGHPSCGAVLVFTGTTRGENRGRQVLRLEYEAFEEMTEPEMGRIFAECLEAFGPASTSEAGLDGEGQAIASGPSRRLRMLCQHRIGSVEVGGPSVVIAVASPHRDTSFRACRFLIDTLKQRLPIWKKEIYPGGEHWVGERS